jgi:hypothetical protein
MSGGNFFVKKNTRRPKPPFGARENQINAYRISERSMSNAKLMLLVQSKPLRQHGQDVMNGVSYGEAQNLVFPRAERRVRATANECKECAAKRRWQIWRTAILDKGCAPRRWTKSTLIGDSFSFVLPTTPHNLHLQPTLVGCKVGKQAWVSNKITSTNSTVA